MVADKGYSARTFRSYLRRRGIKTTIPERVEQLAGRKRRRERPCGFDKAAYRRRNVVEYGGGEVILYAYGPDADALFAVMAPILNDLPLRPAHVVLRYGSVVDPSAAEHRVEL